MGPSKTNGNKEIRKNPFFYFLISIEYNRNSTLLQQPRNLSLFLYRSLTHERSSHFTADTSEQVEIEFMTHIYIMLIQLLSTFSRSNQILVAAQFIFYFF